MIVTTTLQAIAIEAIKLQAEGRLGYQSEENRKDNQCRYLYPDGRRCAIGAGLPLDAAETITAREDEINVVFSVTDLLTDKALEITDDYSIRHTSNSLMSVELQSAHDDLVVAELDGREQHIRQAKFNFILSELAAGNRPMLSDITEAKDRAEQDWLRENDGDDE